MATSVPGSDSPVQEPFIFPEDWDEPFAQWTGDEFPSLFGDLPDGTDLNVGDAPSNIFDDFPIGPDLDVGVGPSNLFDDSLNGADVPLGVGPSVLLDDFSIGVDVNVHGEPSDLIDGFPMGLAVNVHDGSEFSADYRGALTYDIGTLSLPTATDSNLLPRMEYAVHDLLQPSAKTTSPSILPNQSAQLTGFELQPSLGTRTDGAILSCFKYSTINSLQTHVCNDLAMSGNCESAADISAAANSLAIAPLNTILDPSHADSTDDYLPQSAGRADSTSPTSLFCPNTRIYTQAPLVGKPMALTSTSEKIPFTHQLAPEAGSLVNNEKEQNQPHLGWISYNQSSFTDNTIVPTPIHTCNLPDNRKRGRHEPLSESKRMKIAEMRQLKSCLLCRMKKKDVPGLPLSYAESTVLIKGSVTTVPHVNGASMRREVGPLCYRAFVLLLLILLLHSSHTWPHWLTRLHLSFSHMDSDETISSSTQEALNTWANNALKESTTKVKHVHDSCSAHQNRVLEVISQVLIYRARPPVVKDALKILLLIQLLKIPNIGIQRTYASGKKSSGLYTNVPARNRITIQSCVISLIEQILSKLLPQLQALLLQRYDTDWAVVVSAMTALSMTAEEWVSCNSDQYLEGPSSKIKDGWNVLLGLYTAAYGGYHLLRANSAKLSRSAQSDETALMLLNKLKIWAEHDGIARHYRGDLLNGLQLTPKQVIASGAGINTPGSTIGHPRSYGSM